ncbi:MAG: EutN/CcmL family microcompartment protein [Myxococcales bacterium]|nr:EutN/CcmL family microcompartment protein [Myxococcales bacterium]
MKLARVLGTVVSTIKHPAFDHRTLLYCDVLTPAGDPDGQRIIAVDHVQAGVGDTVLILDEGNGARQILGPTAQPVRAVIVGIVDEVELVR